MARLNQVKSRQGVLKTWSCLTFSVSDHSVKWKVFTQQVHRKKLPHTVLMAFVDTETLPLKLWDVFINIIHVKNVDHLSLRKKLSEALKKES